MIKMKLSIKLVVLSASMASLIFHWQLNIEMLTMNWLAPLIYTVVDCDGVGGGGNPNVNGMHGGACTESR